MIAATVGIRTFNRRCTQIHADGTGTAATAEYVLSAFIGGRFMPSLQLDQQLAEHVATLERIAERQEGPSASRAVEVVRVVSDEEAGKFLILLDVARAAFARQGRLSNGQRPRGPRTQ